MSGQSIQNMKPVDETLLQCPLCGVSYNNPILLPCLHSACLDCVRDYLLMLKSERSGADDYLYDGKNSADDTSLQCPVCKKLYGVQSKVVDFDNLKPNYFLTNLKELADCKGEEPKPCDYCNYDDRTQRASHRCLECQDNLCESCFDAHRRTKLTRSHLVRKMSELKQGLYDSDMRNLQQLPCDIHKEEPVKFYCRRCERLICRECKVSSHENHHCSDVNSAADEYRNKVRPVVETIERKIPNIRVFLQFLSEYEEHLTSSHDDVAKSIEKQAASLHSLINIRKSKLLDELEKATKTEREAVELKKVGGEHLLESLNSGVGYAKTVMDHGKPEEILSVKEQLFSRLKELSHMNADPLPNKLKASFTLGNFSEPSLEVLFGKLSTYRAPLDEESMRAICHTDEIPITAGLPGVGESVEMVGSFECRSPNDLKDIWPTGLALTRDDRIIVLDRENKRVKFFDKDGTFQREFGQGELGCPYDIVLMKNGNLAITDYDQEDVKIYTMDGSLMAKMTGPMKYPRGITVDADGSLIIVDAHKHQLIIHEPVKGEVVQIIEGKDESDNTDIMTDPYYVATNTNDQIIVSDWVAPHIKIFNRDGKCFMKYGTYGVNQDQCLQPYGVCTDNHGFIYVADNQNHRIHMLSPAGKFLRFIVSRIHGLWHPMALAFNSQGHLVVTEALGKVKTFKIC